MNLEQLTDLFKWMTIINVGILILSSVLVMAFKNIAYKMQAKLFGIKDDQAAIVVYGYLGILKLLVIIFNIVPYISLLLIQ